MHKSISVSTPGKIHLMGEHSVVYGKPALLSAIDKRCKATIYERKDKKIEIILKNLKITKTFSFTEILTKGKQANRQWLKFKETGDMSVLKNIAPKSLDYMQIAISEALLSLNIKPENGFSIAIYSDIPFGSGFGSSAAVAIAIIGAIFVFFGKTLDTEKIFYAALKTEQKKHGNPSGGDIAACLYGKMIRFEKLSETQKNIEPLNMNLDYLADKFSIINTGKPDETTGEMISRVKSKIEKILDKQGKFVDELILALKHKDKDLIKNIIQQGEKNLEALGVVSKSTQALIRDLEKAGVAAKICGAGGIKKASGIVLVFADDFNIVKTIANKHGFKLEHIQMGAEGVRREI